jgi:hypothetical protein
VLVTWIKSQMQYVGWAEICSRLNFLLSQV